VTIVDDHGYAVGHGIARAGRARRQEPQPPGPASCALPARVNITVTETLLRHLAAQTAQPRSGAPPGDWEFAPQLIKDGYGTWTLTLPSGQGLTVRFDIGSTPTRRATGSAAWSRSAIMSARSRPVPGPPVSRTLSMRCRTTRTDRLTPETRALAA